jgi:hypothetical protein
MKYRIQTQNGKPFKSERTSQECSNIAYALHRNLVKSTDFDASVIALFQRYARNGHLYNFKIKQVDADINLLGQVITRYDLTADTDNENKYLACFYVLTINGINYIRTVEG